MPYCPNARTIPAMSAARMMERITERKSCHSIFMLCEIFVIDDLVLKPDLCAKNHAR